MDDTKKTLSLRLAEMERRYPHLLTETPNADIVIEQECYCDNCIAVGVTTGSNLVSVFNFLIARIETHATA